MVLSDYVEIRRYADVEPVRTARLAVDELEGVHDLERLTTLQRRPKPNEPRGIGRTPNDYG